MLPALLIIALQIVMVAAFGLTPHLTRRSDCFGVSVPEEVNALPEIAKLRRAYLLRCAAAAVVTIVPPAAMLFSGEPDVAAFCVYAACTFVFIGLSFVFYLFAHRTVKRMKAERGWMAVRPQIVAADAAPRKRVPSVWWTAIPQLIFTAASVAIGYACIGALPDMVVTHWDLQMQPDAYTAKGPGLIWMLPVMQLFLAVCMAFAHIAVLKSRRQLDAADPEDSLRRENIFRRAWVWYIALLGGLLAAGFTLMQAAMFQLIDMTAGLAFLLGIAGVSIVGAVALAVALGQGGSRLPRRPAIEPDGVDRDDDRFWKLGMIYYNPDDPAVFVEKRFGVGFTNNLARPATWVMIGGFLALIVGILVAVYLLVS